MKTHVFLDYHNNSRVNFASRRTFGPWVVQ